MITLRDRLSPNQARQAGLRQATIGMLHEPARRIFNRPSFHIERFAYSDIMMNDPTINEQAFHETCKEMFGPNTHIAGRLTETGGCVILMRSDREDDTSKPLLESLRKAASQLTARRPAFIAVQFQEIETSDLMLPHLRWRTGLLSHTLFTHHGEAHVNGTYFCGFAAIVAKGGKIGTPAFGIPNPKPKFPIVPAAAIPFLMHSTNEEFAAAIGAPFPNIDISHFLFDEMLT
ncbi:MAG: hypothetical protein DHS20C03_08780 [Minwuia thermotolerans]|nr:MAG: hypothetical protein DHS20C03_08780 [Minwuia thermotolerans]